MKQKGQICINYGKTNNNYNKRGNIIAKIILHSYSKRNITATFSQAYISLFFKQKWPIIMLSLVIRVAVIYHHSLFCKSKSKSELRNERENVWGHSYYVRSKNGVHVGKGGGERRWMDWTAIPRLEYDWLRSIRYKMDCQTNNSEANLWQRLSVTWTRKHFHLVTQNGLLTTSSRSLRT